MTEFEILRAIESNSGRMRYIDLLNIGLTEPRHNSQADKRRIQMLTTKKYLRGSTRGDSWIYLKPEGQERLDTLRSQCDKEDQPIPTNDAQKNKPNKMYNTIKKIITAVITVISGLVTIIEFIKLLGIG